MEKNNNINEIESDINTLIEEISYSASGTQETELK